MKTSKILLLLLIFTTALQAQQKITVSGFVKDIENGEVLIGTYIIDTINSKGTATNNYGYFSINIPSENTVIKISHIGYKTIILNLNNNNDTIVNVFLHKNLILNEITVTSGYNSLKSSFTGIETITPKMVNALPIIMGESDIIKTLTLMPGVSFGNEAASGYFVRGSSSDQNLLLIDGVPVYNPYHLHGYFSVFNTDAINNATLYKGAIPAKFGDRLASVLDINMRDGNSNNISGKITIGTITTKALLEGPIVKGKTTFLITARRSMLDVFNPIVSSLISFFSGVQKIADDIDVTNYYFYDYNAKINHKFNNKNKLFISIYNSKDNFQNKNSEFNLKNNISWGNQVSSTRWNHVYSNSMFSNLTLYYSNYKYNTKDALFFGKATNELENSIKYESAITDYSAKIDFNKSINTHSLKFGVQYLNQTLKPAITTINQTSPDSNLDTTYNSPTNTHSGILYISDEFKPIKKVSINTGLRFTGYFTQNSFYPSLQPRFSINYMPINKLSIKGSYTRTVQQLHILTDTWNGSPSDMWVPSTSKVKPENSNQLSIGATYNVKKFYFTAEAFIKNMNNLIDYKDGTSYLNNQDNWQNKIATGTGKAHGLELSIKKDKGKLTGLISYTYSKTTRKFQEINNGNEFPYIYDRTHSISTALMYRFSKKFSIGANWIFATGQPVTIAEKYTIDNTYNAIYYKHISSINNIRMPNYHRLDICVNYNKTYPKFNYQISAGTYNVYNRNNPYAIFEGKDSLFINSLLGIIPYITISFGFNAK